MGYHEAAEKHYCAALRRDPTHAPSWISLAQLRTRKLGRGDDAGRVCFEAAERNLVPRERRGQGSNSTRSYLYTAWGGLEAAAGDTSRARSLFCSALEYDGRCSAALVQLGTMEGKAGNYRAARAAYEKALVNDPRNGRVLTAYAILEAGRVDAGGRRAAIDLFERATSVRRGDAGALNAYAVFVAGLGDIESARRLLRRATDEAPKHDAAWVSWGVLETKHGTADEARKVFQQGIWACARGKGQGGNQPHSGRKTAQLWQSWGVLEAKEDNPSEARKHFKRAIDADRTNVPAVVAWSRMEASLGAMGEARNVLERALSRFGKEPSEKKMSLWTGYLQMEEKFGGGEDARAVDWRRGVEGEVLARAKNFKQNREKMGVGRNGDVGNFRREVLIEEGEGGEGQKEEKGDGEERRKRRREKTTTSKKSSSSAKWGDAEGEEGEELFSEGTWEQKRRGKPWEDDQLVWIGEDGEIEARMPKSRMPKNNITNKRA